MALKRGFQTVAEYVPLAKREENKNTSTLLVLDEREVLGKQFRIYGDIENPLFLAKDVAEWIEHSKASVMLDSIDENEKLKETIFTSGQNREVWFLTEDGMYEVLFQSRKPVAKEFKKQVKEILKTIRKHGIYATDSTIDKILNDPDFGIKLLTQLKEERIARIEAEKTNAILMHVNKTYTATEIAKEAGFKSAIALNQWLQDQRVQYMCNGTWVLYSNHEAKGYTELKQEVLDSGRVVYHRRFTQLGRKFILELVNKVLGIEVSE